jgi:hypothetical protein
MSQTMSEREIEEVLASVRRLVAQDERQGRLPPLVLTPEMRVDGAADAEAAPEAAAPKAAEASAPPAEPMAADAPRDVPAAQTAGLPDTVTPGQNMPALTDDAAMQALVAQIVREELSGKLGERITLAVRKLVRNEIARALDEERRK